MTARPGRLLVFWDYDTQWGTDADRARGLPVSPALGALEFAHTERLLDLHAAYAVPACFAVVGAAALRGARPYHDPDQIRRIHAAGHEVASHAWRHEWVPGLGPAPLREMLRRSRAALEDCIGSPVTAFVPPYNQPFDFWPAGSISRSERRLAGPERTDVARLCTALRETGYTFCRVAYRPAPQRLVERLTGRRLDRPGRPVRIAGVTCLRLNTPGGFDTAALAVLERAARRGGDVVVYGHPHSLGAGNGQNERWLVPFLQRVALLRQRGWLRVVRPRDLADGVGAGPVAAPAAESADVRAAVPVSAKE